MQDSFQDQNKPKNQQQEEIVDSDSSHEDYQRTSQQLYRKQVLSQDAIELQKQKSSEFQVNTLQQEEYPSVTIKEEDMIFEEQGAARQQTQFQNQFGTKQIPTKSCMSTVIDSESFHKEFEQIRFNSMQCNLIDMDMDEQTTEQGKADSKQKLSGKNYQEYLEDRIVYIEQPQLINMGYITSYKLYQIKTKKSNSQNGYQTCVNRRFSDFQYLNELFIEKYGGFIIPVLPEKNFWAVINLEGQEYKEIRTKSLIKYLNRVLRHKKLRLTEQLRSFLFEDDAVFSISKGQHTQKKSQIEKKIKNISSEAFQYGKFFYKKIIGLSTGKTQEELQKEEYRIGMGINKGKMTKEDLSLGQFQIAIGDLMRVTKELKIIVQNTIEEIKRIEQLNRLFNMTSEQLKGGSSSHKIQSSSAQSISFQIENDYLYEEYEDLCEFIQSCALAIDRRNHIRSQIESLKAQDQMLSQKLRNAPRSSELDIVRSNLSKYKKLNEVYTVELITQLQIHADEGKGMLKRFIVKFQKIKSQFYANFALCE